MKEIIVFLSLFILGTSCNKSYNKLLNSSLLTNHNSSNLELLNIIDLNDSTAIKNADYLSYKIKHYENIIEKLDSLTESSQHKNLELSKNLSKGSKIDKKIKSKEIENGCNESLQFIEMKKQYKEAVKKLKKERENILKEELENK